MEEKFIELLKSTKREGIEDLIEFIKKTDFFTAPASTRFHGCYEKGLLEHSMKVYEILKQKASTAVIPINTPEESIILIALLHDICKANFKNNLNNIFLHNYLFLITHKQISFVINKSCEKASKTELNVLRESVRAPLIVFIPKRIQPNVSLAVLPECNIMPQRQGTPDRKGI